MKKITVHGTGSAIADSLYTGVDFNGSAFQKYGSRKPGDGGMEAGKLVLTEDFETFAGKPADEVVAEIVGNRGPDTLNLGGPGPVALINTAQLTSRRGGVVRYYSTNGNDKAGQRLMQIMSGTPLDLTHLKTIDAPAPITFVLSDPNYNGGSGERTFINGIRSAWHIVPEDLDDTFYNADIVLFGGTALVPEIHADLTSLTRKSKERGCITIVTTVYDFRNEKAHPDRPWPLGVDDETYRNLDLLITDREEAIRLSGAEDLSTATRVLIDKGVSALIVTNGATSVFCYADGSRFAAVDTVLPVSHAVEDARANHAVNGDTTGAGDNFAGGVVASLVMQLQERPEAGLRLPEACAWGISSGDFACFYVGGTYLESTPGEKERKIRDIVNGFLTEHRELFNDLQ